MKARWLDAIRRYAIATLALHLVWEVIQLPLFTIWSQSAAKQAFAVVHCTAGDLAIAGLALLVALVVTAKPDWPEGDMRRFWLLLLATGLVYTVYSEWLNTQVRGNWAYAPLMPVLPVLGTGLSPLAQWIVVPTIALRTAIGRWPWRGA
ncbi:MAG: hypothetical protein R3D68_15405 [Hyphomicrobiaceae bacterium]